VKRILIIIIRLYQIGFSPYLGVRCRFIPSCSDYFKEAVIEEGFLFGMWLGLKRFCRCHPWGGSGYAPLVRGRDK